MITDRAVLDAIRACVDQHPIEIREAVEELADHLRHQVIRSGDPVGRLAIAMVHAELALDDDERRQLEGTPRKRTES